MKRFLIIGHSLGKQKVPTQWEFDTAHEVAVFMWGKTSSDYSIFVRGNFRSSNVEIMEKRLAHAEWVLRYE